MKGCVIPALLSSAAGVMSWSQFVNKDFETPPKFMSSTGLVQSYTFKQRLNHFNGLESNKFFEQVVHVNTLHPDTGPIFIYIGGEAPLGADSVLLGMVPEMAHRYKARLYGLEHRFYGKSFPKNQDLDSDTIQYLNTDQALADLASFISSVKKYDDQPVIVFGCSYPGSLAAYARSKYPHLITGAIASSAPVLAKSDFDAYDRVLVDVIHAHDSNKCFTNLRAAIKVAEKVLSDGGEEFDNWVNGVGCGDMKIETDLDKKAAHYVFADAVAFAVQYNTPSSKRVQLMCDALNGVNTDNDEVQGADIDTPGFPSAEQIKVYTARTGAFMKPQFRFTGSCEAQRMTGFLPGSADRSARSMRAWLYQSCAEYGYWQVAPTDPNAPTARPASIDLDFHHQLCNVLFPLSENGQWEDLASHANVLLGGRDNVLGKFPGASNIHFTNGSNDPWKELSILDVDAKANSRGITSFVIEDASHCADFSLKVDLTQPRSITLDQAIKSFLNPKQPKQDDDDVLNIRL